MFKKTGLSVALAALFSLPPAAQAASSADLKALHDEIEQLKQSYQQRIAQLEARLQQAEAASRQATEQAAAAQTAIEQASIARANSGYPTTAATPASGGNAYNPEISLVLSGSYGHLGQTAPITGFAMAANNTGYTQGLSLKESELGFAANIDPDFRGVATLSLLPAGGVAVENAFVQSTALGNGFNLKFGRYFSGLGYLNEQHAHAWDFVDQPLVYRVLWDNQLAEDGIQLKWLAPTELFVELGGEIGRGMSFPGSNRAKNGLGAGVLYAHLGDDIGLEQSWRAGVSLHETRRVNAVSNGVPDLVGTVGGVSNRFSGDSRTVGLDAVWKYTPGGSERHFKLQGEYFQRREAGLLSYNLLTTDSYANTQSGWYLQGVYQFMPHWRSGLRYDSLDSGIARIGALNAGNVIGNYGFSPARISWMLDYSPSEFSRFRLQLARDQSRQGLPDNQLFLQYIMSLGAHGAHQY